MSLVRAVNQEITSQGTQMAQPIALVVITLREAWQLLYQFQNQNYQ